TTCAAARSAIASSTCWPSVLFTCTPPTSEPHTLSLHDALPIFTEEIRLAGRALGEFGRGLFNPTIRLGVTGLSGAGKTVFITARSEEHTSELQSQSNLVCRLLLEKKNS